MKKNTLRSLFALLTALVMAVCLLTGCGAADTEPVEAQEDAETIQVYLWTAALYDTYAISGLPAGPISCPGYAAMEAALNPDEEYISEGYYFFVTGHPGTDVAGQYFYAKTADEHYQNCVKAGWAS